MRVLLLAFLRRRLFLLLHNAWTMTMHAVDESCNFNGMRYRHECKNMTNNGYTGWNSIAPLGREACRRPPGWH